MTDDELDVSLKDDGLRDRYEATITFESLAQQFIDDHGMRDVWEAYQEELYVDWVENLSEAAAPAMKYESPIQTDEHEAFCRAEAERRYNGKIIRDGEMLLVEDENGVCHTDAVLRALSFQNFP